MLIEGYCLGFSGLNVATAVTCHSPVQFSQGVQGHRAGHLASGGRSKLLRTVKETVIRSRAYAYRDRRTRKRTFRALWITRLSAACQERGLSYSVFIHGLATAGIELESVDIGGGFPVRYEDEDIDIAGTGAIIDTQVSAVD